MSRPEPPAQSPPNGLRPRIGRILPSLVAFSLAVAALAVLLVAHDDDQLHIHMMIATGLGVFLTVLLGTGLMTLTFLSNSSGHDQSVARNQDQDDQRP